MASIKYTERAISESLGHPNDDDDDDDDDDESSESSEDSDRESSPRDKTVNRTPRRVAAPAVTCSPRVKDDERQFERTAMRLLKRTASGDSKLPGQHHQRRRRESATESDSEEYSSASSELDEIAQSELMRRTAIMSIGSRQKHAPAVQAPKSVETDYWTSGESPVTQIVNSNEIGNSNTAHSKSTEINHSNIADAPNKQVPKLDEIDFNKPTPMSIPVIIVKSNETDYSTSSTHIPVMEKSNETDYIRPIDGVSVRDDICKKLDGNGNEAVLNT